ncbi:hypothetical protein Maqu_4115 (plasmid) [Marinobacter nauticus VT8]|uniref:Uncharacterized protein n=1 Tax=Marinobacter nauticus (strain ATCC 700491 / DSM 11845 / VT8) TaxID=351348 RepID=A1U7K1_MARN8|nr:hypothetical protein Maqu_4115 [Marinobacter nauticus VT8]
MISAKAPVSFTRAPIPIDAESTPARKSNVPIKPILPNWQHAAAFFVANMHHHHYGEPVHGSHAQYGRHHLKKRYMRERRYLSELCNQPQQKGLEHNGNARIQHRQQRQRPPIEVTA